MKKSTWKHAYTLRFRKFKKRLSNYVKSSNPLPKKELKQVKKKPSKMMANRIARMIENGGSHTILEWQNLLESTGHKCVGCSSTSVKLYRDHIVPVCKGGSDFISNIQPLCQKCNFLKAGKHPYSFAVSS